MCDGKGESSAVAVQIITGIASTLIVYSEVSTGAANEKFEKTSL